MHPDLRRVTLEQLLTHRSGLGRNPSMSRADATDGSASERVFALLADATARAPEYPPGTVYHYSNSGVAIAGAMLERAAGQPVGALVRERVIAPLGLNSYGFGRMPRDNQPRGHHFLTGRTWNLPFFPAREPELVEYLHASGAYCTIPDFALYAAFLLRAIRGESELLDPATCAYMYQRSGHPAFGLGRQDNGRFFDHQGAISDFWCDLFLLPGERLGLVVFTNEGNAKRVNAAFQQTRQQLMGEYRARAEAASAPQ